MNASTGIRATLVISTFLIVSLGASSHEVRPAYLELRELSAGVYSVLWKTPARGEMRLALSPEFSGRTEPVTPMATRESQGAIIQTWQFKSVDPLPGQTIRIAGLRTTMTDALIRVEFASKRSWVARLTPQQPSALVPEQQGAFAVALVYLKLGIEHILLGIDHLLFVLALLLITKGAARLVKTVTAFTVAHSITLALATLGFVHVPQKPVEAIIALSIVFVAAEILLLQRGQKRLAAEAPWIVAFTFGLLHGFGFAGALSEVGLPEGQIPLALLFFNAGVEAGQLMFVATLLCAIAVVHRMRVPMPRWAQLAPPYAIGSVAMFWVIERVAAF